MHLCSTANELLVNIIITKNSFVKMTIKKNRKRPVEYEIKEHIFTSACYQVQRLLRDVAKHGLGGLKPDQIASKPDQIYYSPFLCWGLEYISCEKNSLLAS